jgi:hypothetical protein
LIFCSSSSIKAGPLFVVSTLKILFFFFFFYFYLKYLFQQIRKKKKKKNHVSFRSPSIFWSRAGSVLKKKKISFVFLRFYIFRKKKESKFSCPLKNFLILGTSLFCCVCVVHSNCFEQIRGWTTNKNSNIKNETHSLETEISKQKTRWIKDKPTRFICCNTMSSSCGIFYYVSTLFFIEKFF